jgi:hypothetical protein
MRLCAASWVSRPRKIANNERYPGEYARKSKKILSSDDTFASARKKAEKEVDILGGVTADCWCGVRVSTEKRELHVRLH